MTTEKPVPEKKTMTLLQFENACGGPMPAAVQAGVDLSTWGRWTSKKHKPRGNNARRLKELGVLFAVAFAPLLLGGCASASRIDMVDARVLDWGGGNTISIVKDPVTKATCFTYSRGGINCQVPR